MILKCYPDPRISVSFIHFFNNNTHYLGETYERPTPTRGDITPGELAGKAIVTGAVIVASPVLVPLCLIYRKEIRRELSSMPCSIM